MTEHIKSMTEHIKSMTEHFFRYPY